jgi:pimeloyl-ACP methyl ester carboxylesterase
MTAHDNPITQRQVQLEGVTLRVLEQGPADAPAFVLLHGWPGSVASWQGVFAAAGPHVRLIAVDLPGIGGSFPSEGHGSKQAIATDIHELIVKLELDRPTLVGHDAGGMVAYAYLRAYADVARVVIMDTVVPGVDPWEAVVANPHIWHFAFHSVPDLPERLVQGNQRAYFDYFYEELALDPDGIDEVIRAANAAAYRDDSALGAGFDLYRALTTDARDNIAAAAGPAVDTPLTYLRGSGEYGELDTYLDGFRAAGITNVDGGIIDGAGHFAPEEAPAATWAHLSRS